MNYASPRWLGRRSNVAVPPQPQPAMQARRIGTMFETVKWWKKNSSHIKAQIIWRCSFCFLSTA